MLTKEQIKTMPAGWEISAAVGRAFPSLVTGWNYFAEATNGNGHLWSGVSYPSPEAAWKAVADRKPAEGHGPWIIRPVECFSEEIAAAWKIVERFPNIVVQRAISPDGSVIGYRCSVPDMSKAKVGQPMVGLNADADTAPLAICRAALLAVLAKQAA